VIVGVAQTLRRPDPAEATDPVAMMADALRLAADDAGSGGAALLQRADSVRVAAVLSWRYTDPRTVVADGIVPFFIDWGKTPHPAATAAPGASLIAMHAEHPDAARVQDTLNQLGVDLRVQHGASPALVATIKAPRGTVTVR